MATEATRRFLWIFLPIAAVLSAIGGYWIKGHSPHEIDRALAKDYARQFAKVRSAAQAMVQLDSCLLLYGLAHDDGFPGDLEAVGPEGSKCTYAALLDTASRLKYRFVYFPTAEDPKGIARGFLLQAYPLFMPDGQLAPEGTPAEFFANENGLVLVRKEFGTAREHVEPLLGLPKTLQALSARFTSGSRLPIDQPAARSEPGAQRLQGLRQSQQWLNVLSSRPKLFPYQHQAVFVGEKFSGSPLRCQLPIRHEQRIGLQQKASRYAFRVLCRWKINEPVLQPAGRVEQRRISALASLGSDRFEVAREPIVRSEERRVGKECRS